MEAWNSPDGYIFAGFHNYPPDSMPEGVNEIFIACVAKEEDSLNLYLVGIDNGVNCVLLAEGGYRGEYNFAKSDALYREDTGEFSLLFQMPFSARYAGAEYVWNRYEEKLVLMRTVAGDPSLDALERIDILLEQGDIAGASDVLYGMFYPGNYYEREEMFCHFLRSTYNAALTEFRDGNCIRAVQLFGVAEPAFVITAHTSLWYEILQEGPRLWETGFAELMDYDEFITITNDYGFFLEQCDSLEKAKIVLCIVADMVPDRMVVHLNLADVYWKQGKFSEACEEYKIYHEMMNSSGLGERIPPRVFERM
jgi:tetratricopeptide (TPR) repeat protein